MGKLTYLLKNERNGKRAHVIVDGTDVHASHPKGEHRLISFQNESDKAALVKFQAVIKQHFHPRDGWVLEEKRPGVADYPEWPKPPTEAEIAAAAAADRQRRLGYVLDAEWMALDLSKQRTVSDLEIALEHALEVEVLWVLTNSSSDGSGPNALLTRLHKAIPRLRELFIDCPWDTLTRACTIELRGLDAYLEQHKLTRLHATGELSFKGPIVQPTMVSLALCADPIDEATFAQIAARTTPKLKTLQLCMSVEGAADSAAANALASVLAPSLETLTLVGLPSVEGAIAQLLEATGKRKLPARVELDGSCGDGAALIAAATSWKERAPGSVLALGDSVFDLIDANATADLTELVGAAFDSPFMPEAHGLRARALWAQLA